MNAKSGLKDLLFGDFAEVPSKQDPTKMTLQPKHELRNFEEEEEKHIKKIKTFDISDESSEDD